MNKSINASDRLENGLLVLKRPIHEPEFCCGCSPCTRYREYQAINAHASGINPTHELETHITN